MTDLAALRARIDELDASVIALLAERRAVSREIQALRASSGDGPVAHAREAAIGDAYVGGLGDEDAREVALAILVLCRGRHV
ncbi:MAG: chorismate mutase [Candidatus Nanopelagicales bacterium]